MIMIMMMMMMIDPRDTDRSRYFGQFRPIVINYPNVFSHLQALPSVSSQRSIEGPCSREQTPSED